MDLTFSTRTLSCCSLAATVFLCDEKREETSQPSSFFFWYLGHHFPHHSETVSKMLDSKADTVKPTKAVSSPKESVLRRAPMFPPLAAIQTPQFCLLPTAEDSAVPARDPGNVEKKITSFIVMDWDMVEYNTAIGISRRALG